MAHPVGFLSKESIMLHRLERYISGRRITKADVYKWPNISIEGASKLYDICAFVGSPASSRPVKLQAVTFTDRQSPSRPCQCFALSLDGKLLAASFDIGETSSILIWRLSDGMVVQRLQTDGNQGTTTCLAFSPESREILSGDQHKIATAWSIRTGTKCLCVGPHKGPITAVAYSPYEPYVATASHENPSFHLWDRSTGERLATFDGSIQCVIREITFTPPTLDTSNVYARTLDSSFIYNLRSSTRLRSIDHAPVRDGMNTGSGFFARSVSHDGDRILVDTEHHGLEILDARSGELRLAIRTRANLSFPAGFSVDDKEVYARCRDADAAQSFDSRTGDRRHHYELSGTVAAGAYSPDGAYLAFCTTYGKVHVYDPASGSFLAKVGLDLGYGDYEIAFGKDSQNLVVNNRGSSAIHLLNVADIVKSL